METTSKTKQKKRAKKNGDNLKNKKMKMTSKKIKMKKNSKK
jgi:hypothetical protein